MTYYGESWIITAKTRTIADVASALGMDVRRDRFGPCPACGEQQEKHVRRWIAGITRGGMAWVCNHCKAAGDVVDLAAWKLTGKSPKSLDRDGWLLVRTWFDDAITPPASGYRVTPQPDYPPQTEVAALWAHCARLFDTKVEDAEVESILPIFRWLQSRGLNEELVAALDLLRITPSKRPEQLAKGERRVQCWGWPWIAAFPLFDATGAQRSLLFRAIETPPDWLPRKSLALRDYDRAGLVLADPIGTALLSNQLDTLPVGWNGKIYLVEGEPDYLTMAAHADRVQGGRSYAVFGVVGAVILPEAVGKRIPPEAQVFLCPDLDPVGQKAMERSRIESLAHVKDVRRINLRRVG